MSERVIEMNIMKYTLWRTTKEKCLFIFLLSLVIITWFYAGFYDRNTRREDVNGDGADEVVKEIQLPDGGVIRTIIEEDGTMYVTEYNPQNEVTHKWMVVPSENEGEDPRIYVWDEKTKQWLPDQDKDGIPDN
jgi:hypothetical protein